MNFKTLLLSGFTCVSISACTSAPKIPQLNMGVLQDVHNIDVYPNTTRNKARLTKLTDKCVIEFTGKLKAGKSVEQWAFKGFTLISAHSSTFAQDGSSTASNFDLNAADVQKNFLALRNNFHKKALAQCN